MAARKSSKPLFSVNLEGVKRRSPLEVLKDLRQRAHEQEQAALGLRLEAEKAAEVEEERARQRLLDSQMEARAAQSLEDQRLESTGITAKEGQWRVAWQGALRRTEHRLAHELDRASVARREASLEQERAQSSLKRADAELKAVEERLDVGERARRLDGERSQQETLDEASLRRFMERHQA